MNDMPLRKSWHWMGAFDGDVMLCVADAQVGRLQRSWWAVWDGARLREGSRGVDMTTTGARVRQGDAQLDLRWEGGTGVHAAGFYEGKTITFIIGSSGIGGSYDTFSRLMTCFASTDRALGSPSPPVQ